MEITIKGSTSVSDLVIDYIEAELKSGQTVSLNWDYSDIDRNINQFEARYSGICFNEERADGKIDEMVYLRITSVGMYSESSETADLEIKEMIVEEDGKVLHFEKPFSVREGDSHG